MGNTRCAAVPPGGRVPGHTDAAIRGRRSADATTIDDILKSAREEFAANGFDSAKVDAICRGANVSRQLLYYYFGSKSGLYSIILEEAARDTSDLIDSGRYDQFSPRTALAGFIRDMFRDYVERPQIVKMTIDEAQHNFTHVGKQSLLAQVLRKLISDVLASIIARGIASGDFRSDADPDKLFWVIYSLVTTWFAYFPLVSIVSSVNEGSELGFEEWCDNSIEFVLASVSGRP